MFSAEEWHFTLFQGYLLVRGLTRIQTGSIAPYVGRKFHFCGEENSKSGDILVARLISQKINVVVLIMKTLCIPAGSMRLLRLREDTARCPGQEECIR